MLKIRFLDQRRDPVWMVDKSFTIGTANDNQLVIQDPSIHEHHAKVVYANHHFTLHDLGSAEGVFVNDQRITQKTIQNGDRLKIGQVELEVLDPTLPENQPEWCLVACSSWLAGQQFPLRLPKGRCELRIGRAKHCDLIFAGTHLSRDHAILTLNGDSILVRDLNSANGTFINDVRISEGVIYAGDQLRLDVYSFRLYGPGARPAPMPRTYDEETKIRIVRHTTEDEPAVPPAGNTKRWKTRPTSPGNRSDEGSPTDQYPLMVKIIAAGLVMAVTALVAYLIVG